MPSWCARVEKLTTGALCAGRQEGVRPAGPPVLRGLRAADGGLAVAGGAPRVPGQGAHAGAARILPAGASPAKGAPAAHGVPGSPTAPGASARGPARHGVGRQPSPAVLRGVDRRVPGHRPRPVFDLPADIRPEAASPSSWWGIPSRPSSASGARTSSPIWRPAATRRRGERWSGTGAPLPDWSGP